MFRTRLVAVLLAAGVLVIGCSDSHDGRLDVSGTVKLKGSPIKDGAIVMFEPVEKQDTAANVTVTGGSGAYAIPRSAGLKPGKYLVRITAGDGKTPDNPLNPDAPPGPTKSTNIISKDLVPADWNVNSKQYVTVTKDGSNKFDFDIP
jgi:hypothetical protein